MTSSNYRTCLIVKHGMEHCVLVVIFRVGHAFACVLLVFLVVVIAQGCVTAQTAPTVAPKVTIELSPATINAGSNTTLAVTVSDPGNSSFTYSQLNITTIIPPRWKCESDVGADCSIHSVLNLMKGQSNLTEYRISIPPDASQGDYMIHVRVSWNQTYSAIYSARVSVQYVLGPSLPGEIPFVLAVMILPGFIAFAIGVYLGGSKLSDCSVLQLVLVSILFGAFIWQTGGLSIILATSNANVLLKTLSNTDFFQTAPFDWSKFWTILNLQNIWVRTGLIAIAIAIAARIGSVASWVWQKLGLTSPGKLWQWWDSLVGGPEEVRTTAWETQMRYSRLNIRGYRRKITLTLAQQTKPSDAAKPPDQTKTLTGLFVAGEKKDPLNLILDPQYIVEDASNLHLDFTSAPFWHRLSYVIRQRKDMNHELSGLIIEKALKEARENNKKISTNDKLTNLTGRTLIREQVLEWEISPDPEPIAKFRIGDGYVTPYDKSKK